MLVIFLEMALTAIVLKSPLDSEVSVHRGYTMTLTLQYYDVDFAVYSILSQNYLTHYTTIL